MKTCPVCHKPVALSLLYCTNCGADLRQPVATRRERLLLVLSPFFLILMTTTLSVELRVVDAVDNGLAYGGALALVYLLSALAFATFSWLFKLPALPQSYWQAGLSVSVSFVACVLLSFQAGELAAENMRMGVGPVKYHLAVLETLAVIFLPVCFSCLLAVSARARVTRFPESAVNQFLRFLFKYALVLLPAFVVLLSFFVDISQPPAKRAMVRARILYELQAAELALQVIDTALVADENYAPLHFIKGMTIIDHPSATYSAVDAVKHLERANELIPRVPTWLYRLSMAYDLERNGAGAIAAASEATGLLPEDAFLWQYLGDLNMKYKHGPASVSAYKKALELTPEDPLLLNNLAFTMLELDMELPQALEMARISVELLPDRVFNLDTLAWAYYKNGQYAEALEIMAAIFAGRSEVTPEIDFHYARILQAKDMLANPLETYDKLLARPEVAADHHLFQQIYRARTETESRIASNSASLTAEKEDAVATNSAQLLKKDITPADNSPELAVPEENSPMETEQ